jgi:hypothetical protein
MKASSVWFWLLLTLVVIGLMTPFWTGHVPAFRDGLHYYFPQYHWLDVCYTQGQYFPAWCSAEGLGIPPTSQPAWQLFYPLRVTWLIPGLTLPQKYGLFLSIHLMLAAVGVWRLAGVLRLTVPAKALAAVSYCLSCPVAFQYCNPIYLCSAAWIGWSLITISRLALTGSSGYCRIDWRWLLNQLFQLSSLAGLMLLGGDPHNAVNLGIISLPSIAIWIWNSYSGSKRAEKLADVPQSLPINPWQLSKVTQNSSNRILRTIAGLGGLIVLALTAMQIACTYRWIHHSVRADKPVMRCDSFQPRVDAILANSQTPTPLSVYNFSISPWYLPTACWPHWTGYYQPNHSRWADCIGSEGSMWIPSLYFGLIPLWLATQRWRRCFREHSMVEIYLAVLAALAMLAAMGNYSPGWAVRQILYSLGFDEWSRYLPSDSLSSVYGLLNLIVPGYDKFRYPAKWIVWSIACLSVLAAKQLDAIQTRPHASFSSAVLKVLLGLSFLGLTLSWVVQFDLFSIGQWLQIRLIDSFDRLLGTAQLPAAISTWRYSLGWPMMITMSFICLCKCCPQRWMPWGLVIVTLADLSLCSGWWITTTHPSQIQTSTTLPESPKDRSLVWANPAAADIRNLPAMETSTQQDRQIAIQQAFLWNKLGIVSGVSAFHASDSLEPNSVRALKNWMMQKDDMSSTQPELDWVLAHLGITHRLIFTSQHQYQWKPISHARELCELVRSTPNNSSTPAPESSVRWQWQNCQTLEVDVQLETSATLIIRQYNDGKWIVHCTRDKIVNLRSGELFLVMDLPAGEYRLIVSRSI